MFGLRTFDFDLFSLNSCSFEVSTTALIMPAVMVGRAWMGSTTTRAFAPLVLPEITAKFVGKKVLMLI